MNLRIFPTAVIRIPKISYKNDLESSWEDLKNMIRDSSPEFYAIIKNMNFYDLSNSERRIKSTIWKYFNRARFRATPFGSFSSSGCIKLTDNISKDPIIYLGQDVHGFVDWSTIEVPAIPSDMEGLTFISNSSFYVVGAEIRYLRRIDEDFEIATIEFGDVIIEVLKFAEKIKTYSDLKAFMTSRQLDTMEIDSTIRDMLELQLLLCSLNANIIGEDYFKRINSLKLSASPIYKIAEATLDHDQIDKNMFKHFPAVVRLLSNIAGDGTPSDLKAFADRFFGKFEQANIPLMKALDPELGVGYTFNEQKAGSDDEYIGNLIKLDNTDHASKELNFRIISNFISETGIKKEVRLEDIQTGQANSSQLPNSLSAICTVADGTVWLEYLGGATANSLLGRFTPAIEGVEQICREMAAVEMKSNPDVLFFDIGYMAEAKVDNINRRRQVYDLQLDILNFDDQNRSLPISDIFLCVKNGRVILYSANFNRRVVPRISSAYNYRRSSLPLFRMLCDLMYQDIIGELILRPQLLFPGQSFYPRISFKNIVISPATWHIKWESRQGDAEQHVRAQLKKWEIPRYVKTGRSDQTLFFDTQNPEDLIMLADIIRKQGLVVLSEAPLPEKSIVEDIFWKPYLSQIIVSLYHEEQIITPFSPIINNGEDFRRWVAPGREWLYFEIYVSHFRADEILVNKLTPYLAEVSPWLTSWFFIRYSDNGEHIRLRLKLKDPAAATILTDKLSFTLEQEFKVGIVSDIKICTYKKEVHRYGKENMKLVEDHFYIDSKFILGILPDALTNFQKYDLCVQLLLIFRERSDMDKMAFETMVEKIILVLSKEHGIDPGKFKTMNAAYKQFKNQEKTILSLENGMAYKMLIESFIVTVGRCEANSRKIILGDLCHMFINRLFSTNQRTHELIIFYFLQKEIKKGYFKANSLMVH